MPHVMLLNLMSCWIAETYTLEAWEVMQGHARLV